MNKQHTLRMLLLDILLRADQMRDGLVHLGTEPALPESHPSRDVGLGPITAGKAREGKYQALEDGLGIPLWSGTTSLAHFLLFVCPSIP